MGSPGTTLLFLFLFFSCLLSPACSYCWNSFVTHRHSSPRLPWPPAMGTHDARNLVRIFMHDVAHERDMSHHDRISASLISSSFPMPLLETDHRSDPLLAYDIKNESCYRFYFKFYFQILFLTSREYKVIDEILFFFILFKFFAEFIYI